MTEISWPHSLSNCKTLKIIDKWHSHWIGIVNIFFDKITKLKCECSKPNCRKLMQNNQRYKITNNPVNKCQPFTIHIHYVTKQIKDISVEIRQVFFIGSNVLKTKRSKLLLTNCLYHRYVSRWRIFQSRDKKVLNNIFFDFWCHPKRAIQSFISRIDDLIL